MAKITLQTIFENKSALLAFAKIFNIPIDDFENEEGNNYLNERFPMEKIKQVRSLFKLRKIDGWLFMNFWDLKLMKYQLLKILPTIEIVSKHLIVIGVL